ncbi:MAG TPA: hypothetical protein VMV31_00075 [Terriglobales bacterium]|nr:hypothetical protein [Terriglobales bacterium]
MSGGFLRARFAGCGWVLAGLLALAPAQAPQAPAGLNPKLVRQYDKLSANAAKQKGPKQAETLAKMAELEFDFARTSYNTQQAAAGQQHLDLAARHADQACALLQAESARGKTNGMKNVEISLQRISFGLKGLAQQVQYFDRPKIEAAINHFYSLRSHLLDWMFAPKHQHL